ncbi:sialin-like [Bacillus rossius redtenbacheri]|uniref:sialin-like n=1 Tax=Bacillus rossius redtenbacheri TaxID=93214 RepID=UPI002FDE5489
MYVALCGGQQRDFEWDSRTQGLVHSAFFYGFTASQAPGGWLAGRVGGSKLFGLAIGGASLLSLMTPSVARAGVRPLLATRALEGLAAGVAHPSLDALWPLWAPPLERGRLVSFAVAGYGAGMVAALLPSGYVAARFGWPWVFYLSGSLGLLWSVLWWLCARSRPGLCGGISPEELAYITESLGHSRGAPQVVAYPWCSIATSAPVWAGVAAIFVGSWNYYTLAAQLPTYMRDVLCFDLGRAGALAAVPYMAVVLVVPAAGRGADWLLIRGLGITQASIHLSLCI